MFQYFHKADPYNLQLLELNVLKVFSIFCYRAVPVSYTHLDVYKRQSLCLPEMPKSSQNTTLKIVDKTWATLMSNAL